MGISCSPLACEHKGTKSSLAAPLHSTPFNPSSSSFRCYFLKHSHTRFTPTHTHTHTHTTTIAQMSRRPRVDLSFFGNGPRHTIPGARHPRHYTLSHTLFSALRDDEFTIPFLRNDPTHALSAAVRRREDRPLLLLPE